MLNFLDLYENTSKQLGRKLKDEEVDFLQWLYDRYSEEKQAGLDEALFFPDSK